MREPTSGANVLLMLGRLLFMSYLVFRVGSPVAAESVVLRPEQFPDVTTILNRTIERAREISLASNAPVYLFEKQAVYQTLSPDGTVKKSKDKTYEVTLSRGMTHNRLVSIDGCPLSAEESAAQSEKERRWRNKYSAGSGNSSPDRMDDIVNERLLARFDFSLAGRETIQGRACHLLTFSPKPGGQTTERLMDRVINLMHGKVWVDEREYEIVRAEVRTEGIVRLWAGFLGALESFEFKLEREPGSPGIWFNRFAEIHVRGRRFFSPVQIRVRELGSSFRPAVAQGRINEFTRFASVPSE